MLHSGPGIAVGIYSAPPPHGAKKVFTLFASGKTPGGVLVLHGSFLNELLPTQVAI